MSSPQKLFQANPSQIIFRGPEGSSTIKISPQATVDELYDQISNQTNIKKANLEVRVGYPNPQSISSSDSKSEIESIAFKSGKVLQVSASQGSSLSVLSPAPSAPGQSTPPSKPARVTNDVGRVPAKSSLSSLARVQDQGSASPSASKIGQNNGLDSVSASVALEAGHLVLRVVPDDNSCLFRAAGILLDHGDYNSSTIDLSHRLRQIVADSCPTDKPTCSSPPPPS
ncbi:hypothetical protein PTTG_29140 [Puccinia triticina 1-1 BBBD Race 1]|uniref:Ubiquitin thioesterase OTU n=1 Tax=Puccinia triticina (isolate 1-1 / race 1 (BBBD)) TaxID=630390 RepID=A0A180G620_PUCT1|nr:hypothetical protein PTTG_29140 [Puccinia triticina 1-1 BBBD Race 1]